ncbi:hypothetical protein ACW9HQ_41210 [Nocardia gipuzkoensis]
MGKERVLAGPASVIWLFGAAVGSVLFVISVVDLAARLAMWSGSTLALVFALPVSALFGIALWTGILGLIWQRRHAYLRRRAATVQATVIGSDCHRLHRTNGFDQHRVRIEVAFTHPETGADLRSHKRYIFSDLRRKRAEKLQARFPPGHHDPGPGPSPILGAGSPRTPCLDRHLVNSAASNRPPPSAPNSDST